MRFALALAAVVACQHRQPAPIETEVVQVAAEPTAKAITAAAPIPVLVTEDDSSLRVFVEHRGRPLPAGWDCHYAVFEDATAVTPLSSAACGELTHFPNGSRAIELQVQVGQLLRKQRLPSERVEGARIETFDLPIPTGRLRVVHEARESPGVSTCSVALTSGGLPVVTGTDDKYFDVFAGTYDATFICQASEGVRSPTITGIALTADQDKELRVAVLSPDTAPAFEARLPTPIVAAPAPVPGAPNAAQYALPGAPAQQNAGADYGEANP